LHQYHIILSSASSLTHSLFLVWQKYDAANLRPCGGLSFGQSFEGKNTLNFLTHKSHFKLSQRYLTFCLLYLTGAFFVSSLINVFVSSLNVWTMSRLPVKPNCQPRWKKKTETRNMRARDGQENWRPGKNRPLKKQRTGRRTCDVMEENHHGKNRSRGNQEKIAAHAWMHRESGAHGAVLGHGIAYFILKVWNNPVLIK